MNLKGLQNAMAIRLMLAATVISSLIVFIVTIALFQKSLPILTTHGVDELFLSSTWQPSKGEFGFYPFIIGSLYVTALAMVMSIPASLLVAIYLSEYAPARIRGMVKPMIDLLAGIPSVVYGLWGVLFVVPFIRNNLAPLIGAVTTGYNLLSGGVVLTLMVLPVTISISDEVIRVVPRESREASMALGATKWQTVKRVVLRSAFPGIVAAIILGFGRAFGETMAVLMVVGNVPKVPSSVFDPAYPIPALIANNYGEMMSIPQYDAALMFAALILLLSVFVFSIVAAMILRGVKRRFAIG